MITLRRHWPIVLILALFLGLGGAYSVVNPLFESPDEVWHYEYVRWLVEGNGLPRPEQVGTAAWHQEGSQPPLYYLAATLITAPIPHRQRGRGDSLQPPRGRRSPGRLRQQEHHAARRRRCVAVARRGARGPHRALSFAVARRHHRAERLRDRASDLPRPHGHRSAGVCARGLQPAVPVYQRAVNNDNLVIAACAAGVWLSVHLLGKYGRVRGRATGNRRGCPGTGLGPDRPRRRGVRCWERSSGSPRWPSSGARARRRGRARARAHRLAPRDGVPDARDLGADHRRRDAGHGRLVVRAQPGVVRRPAGAEGDVRYPAAPRGPAHPGRARGQGPGRLAFGVGRLRLVQRGGRRLALCDLQYVVPGRPGWPRRRLALAAMVRAARPAGDSRRTVMPPEIPRSTPRLATRRAHASCRWRCW